MGSYCLMSTEFQFCKIKRVVEMESGNGCTSVRMYLILLICTSKSD